MRDSYSFTYTHTRQNKSLRPPPPPPPAQSCSIPSLSRTHAYGSLVFPSSTWPFPLDFVSVLIECTIIHSCYYCTLISSLPKSAAAPPLLLSAAPQTSRPFPARVRRGGGGGVRHAAHRGGGRGERSGRRWQLTPELARDGCRCQPRRCARRCRWRCRHEGC